METPTKDLLAKLDTDGNEHLTLAEFMLAEAAKCTTGHPQIKVLMELANRPHLFQRTIAQLLAA